MSAQGNDRLVGAARICLDLHVAHTAIFRVLGQALLPLGVTPIEMLALATADEALEPCTPARLGAVLGHEQQATAGLINRMEVRGWVERRRDLRDRRSVRIALTPAGRVLLDSITTVMEPVLSRINDQMEYTDAALLSAFLRQLRTVSPARAFPERAD